MVHAHRGSSKASLDQQELAVTEHLPRRHRKRWLSDINSGAVSARGFEQTSDRRDSPLGGNDRGMRAIKFTFAGDAKASTRCIPFFTGVS